MPEITDLQLRRLQEKADQYDSTAAMTKMIAKWSALVVLALFAVFVLWRIVGPQLNLYRANTEKQAVIAEQRAQSEAAEYAAKSAVTQAEAKADAEVIRAKGLAEAQAIITETLTEDYLRYLYIQTLEGSSNQVIYVPTEAGLPILEAGRATTTTQPEG